MRDCLLDCPFDAAVAPALSGPFRDSDTGDDPVDQQDDRQQETGPERDESAQRDTCAGPENPGERPRRREQTGDRERGEDRIRRRPGEAGTDDHGERERQTHEQRNRHRPVGDGQRNTREDSRQECPTQTDPRGERVRRYHGRSIQFHAGRGSASKKDRSIVVPSPELW